MPGSHPFAGTSAADAFCAIDFGTSNSAIAVMTGGAMQLVALENDHRTMPTAVFYSVEDLSPHEEAQPSYGRAAMKAYTDGVEGRLMRSMKSILGSPLIGQTTDVGAGRAVRYADVIGGYLQHLKALAERQAGQPLRRAVLGRPVFFVDDDPERDAAAQASLAAAAQAVGFDEVAFQFEPIAAALDYEQQAREEELVLVADIGGGTSDFSLVRVGPDRQNRLERRDDILANHGVHIAGTDFDRHVELTAILPFAGFRALGPAKPGETGREVPSRVYFDLATWHLINTVYAPARVAELRRMHDFYAQPEHHERLMTIVNERLGHALAGAAEQAKIDVATDSHAHIDLGALSRGLTAELSLAQAQEALDADLSRIAGAAQETLAQAGVAPSRVAALYLTGGSTGFSPLVARIHAHCPSARVVRGDRFSSVAQGLALHARQRFAPK